MQIIAPDFYAPFGSSSSPSNEERQGNRLFDDLLRDEEARYRPAVRADREHPETTRPLRENPRREDDLHSDRSEPHGDDRDPHRVTETAGEDHHPEPVGDDRVAGPQDDRNLTKGAETSEGESPAATPASEMPPAQPGETAAVAPAEVLPAPALAAPSVAQPNPNASAQQAAAPGTPISEIARTASQATPGDKTVAAAAVAAGNAPKTAETAKQPAGLTAAPERPVANAAPAAVATKMPNQPAASEQQAAVQPAFPAADRAGRPAGRTVGATRSGDNAQAGLNSRPSATLGGGAATAALSQAGEPVATSKSGTQPGNQFGTQPGNQFGAKSGTKSGATTQATGNETNVSDQAPQANTKPAAAQAATPGKSPDFAAATGADKLVRTTQVATATNGVDTTAGSTAPQSASAVIPGTPGSQVQNSTFAEALTNARQGAPADPAEQVALQVRHAQIAGKDRISIKLHPAELGRIEVKLESGSDGILRAVISAERPDTLDLLQRDARGLERALQEAGVKTDSGSLNFNLRGQGSERQGERDTAGGREPGRDDLSGDAGEAAVAAQQQAASSHNGTLDIRV